MASADNPLVRTRALLVGLAAAVSLVLVTGVVAALEIDARTPVSDGQATAVDATQLGAPPTVTGSLATGASPLPSLPDAPVPPAVPVLTAPTSTPAPAAAPPPPPLTTPATEQPVPTSAPPVLSTVPPGLQGPTAPTVPATIVVPDSWSSQSDATAVEVRISTTAPRAAQPVQFTFEYSSQYPCCDLLVDFGDGSGFQDDAGVTCPEDPPRQPGTRRITTSHTYQAPGTYLFTVGVVAHARCVFPFPEFHSASVSGALVVI